VVVAWLLPQPTGANMNSAEWDEVIRVLLCHGPPTPMIDIAYQGFGVVWRKMPAARVRLPRAVAGVH